MGDSCYLVHLESSGNQRFIFDTTKRRENVGASEVIYRLWTWTENALGRLWPGFDARTWSIDAGNEVEVVGRAGGSVSVVVTDPVRGRRLITEVTRTALHLAPGLDVCGVISEPFPWDGGGSPAAQAAGQAGEYDGRCPLAVRARQVREAVPRVRVARPGPATRFLRLPLVADCAASGLPAADIVRDGSGPRDVQARSLTSIAKREHQNPGYNRLAAAAGLTGNAGGSEPGGAGGGADEGLERGGRLLRDMSDRLGDDDEWVAVIHADGNSLGELFGGLDQHLPDLSCATYARAVRALSEAVDTATRLAFRAAFQAATRACPENLREHGHAPVLPLVLGGDDVTVLCLGRVALPFLSTFLTAFEEKTRTAVEEHLHAALDPVFGDPARTAEAVRRILPGGRGLTACAGLAAVKSHFPFAAAYELAEELTKEAKRYVKAYAPRAADSRPGRPQVSAFSFHVLHDSGGRELKHLRAALSVDGASLVAQPYVTTPGARGRGWVRGRHYLDLVDRVNLVTQRAEAEVGQTADAAGAAGADRERRLPASQLHDLRSALFEGVDVARTRFLEILPRYREAGLGRVCGPDGDLFFEVPAPPADALGASGIPTRMTGLLDAMAAVALTAADGTAPVDAGVDNAAADGTADHREEDR